MVREVDIQRGVPGLNPDLLGAVQELKSSIDELVEGVASFVGLSGAPSIPMTVERYEQLGKIFRLLLWCRMYANEISLRPDLRALTELVTSEVDRLAYDEVAWSSGDLTALYGIQQRAERFLWDLVVKNDRDGDIPPLLQSLKRYQGRLDSLVNRLQALEKAGTLSRAVAIVAVA